MRIPCILFLAVPAISTLLACQGSSSPRIDARAGGTPLATGGLPSSTGGNGGGGQTVGAITGGAWAGADAAAGGAAVGGSSTGGTVLGGSRNGDGGGRSGGQASGGALGDGGAAGGGAVSTGGAVATGGAVSTGGARDAGIDRPVGNDAQVDVFDRVDARQPDTQRLDTRTSTATFRNPLNTTHGSDPFMTYYNGQYYLAATTWGTTLTMKKGATIAALKAATPTVIWQDSVASRKGNMWAPEFYLFDNGAGQPRWYHYYTAGDGTDLGTQRQHVLESDGTDPMGPYHYKARLLDYWAIDGSVLEVNGKRYLMFSAWQGATQNIWIIAMTNPWTVSGARTQLSMPTYAWEKEGTDQVNEGPIALYHEGRTFVTYSASQCASPGYKLGLLELTGTNPLAASAWTKSSVPVFKSAGTVYGTGHNGFFTSPDGNETWLVYHATTNANGSCWTDRNTRIQKVAWDANGLPNFGTPTPVNTDIPVPSGE